MNNNLIIMIWIWQIFFMRIDIFWKTVKPFLSDKGSYTSKINIVNNNVK